MIALLIDTVNLKGGPILYIKISLTVLIFYSRDVDSKFYTNHPSTRIYTGCRVNRGQFGIGRQPYKSLEKNNYKHLKKMKFT